MDSRSNAIKEVADNALKRAEEVSYFGKTLA